MTIIITCFIFISMFVFVSVFVVPCMGKALIMVVVLLMMPGWMMSKTMLTGMVLTRNRVQVSASQSLAGSSFSDDMQ